MIAQALRGIHRRLPIDATQLFVERIMSRTKPGANGCIEWQGATGKRGHGRIHWNRKFYSPHCVIWVASHGQIEQGKLVCHKCDNPRCVNITHLFLGTFLDNVQDMDAKGRRAVVVGAANKLATHSDADVIDVRARWLEGLSHRQIAKQAGYSKSFVQKVLGGDAWSHVERLRDEVETERITNGQIRRKRGNAHTVALIHHGEFAVLNFPSIKQEVAQ